MELALQEGEKEKGFETAPRHFCPPAFPFSAQDKGATFKLLFLLHSWLVCEICGL